MSGDLISLEGARRDRAMRCRIHATSKRVDIALDLVGIACAAIRAVAAVDHFNVQVDQQVHLANFIIECEAAA